MNAFILEYYAAVVLGLTRIIEDEDIRAAVRMEAGVQLQNVLHSLDSGEKASKFT